MNLSCFTYYYEHTYRQSLTWGYKLINKEYYNSSQMTTFEVSQDKRPKQAQNELLSMKWELNLKWKREQKSNQDLIRLVPCVKIVPDPDIQEKLGDVWIIPGYVTLHIDGSEKKMLIPSNPDTVMVLRKSRQYQSDLTSLQDELAITVDLDECEKEIFVEVEIILVKHSLSIIKPVSIPPCDVLQTFGNLLALNEGESKEKFCDVKLTAMERQQLADDECPGQVSFYAHKAILAARSPVFAKMLSHNMKESATNTIELSDIEPTVLKELLTYLYTNECSSIKLHAASLLCHAEKYELGHLKALCEQRLSYDLQIENAAKTLLLADTYRASQLKQNTLLFIREYGGRVLATKDWEDVKTSADLLQELLSTVFESPAKKQKISFN